MQSELVEAQFHEALLNLAVAPDTPLWLLCPYDVDALGADVIEEAQRSHPALVDAEHYRGSTTYGGAYHVGAVFGRELPPPVGPVRNLVVTDNNGPEIAGWIRRWAEGSGLSNERSGRLATALRAICLTSASRAGRSEVLQMWQEGSALICQIHDVGHVQDPLDRPPPGRNRERARESHPAGQSAVRPGPGALRRSRNHHPGTQLAVTDAQAGSGASTGDASTFSSVTRPPGWARETRNDIANTIAMPISTAWVATAKSLATADSICCWTCAGSPLSSDAPAVTAAAAGRCGLGQCGCLVGRYAQAFETTGQPAREDVAQHGAEHGQGRALNRSCGRSG